MYNYVLLLLATFLLIRFNIKNKHNAHYRNQSLLILLAGLLPWVASILYLIRLTPIQGLELTTISTAVSASFFVWALLKGRLLNLVPVARETLMETLPIGVLALDNRDRLQDINQQARVYLELYQEDLLGLTLEQAMSAAKKPCCEGAEALLTALLDKNGPNQVTVSVNQGATTYKLERQPISPSIPSRLVTIQDITREVRQQEELQAAKRKAEESDRLKSAFLANMSHEIRTPMNSIIGFISLLQEDNLSDAEKTEYLDIVRSNGDRLLSTLNDIVDILKIESGQVVINRSSFDINEVLLNCYGLFRQDAAIKQLDFQRPALLMPDVSFIRTDKEKLYSIVTNLVKNALKYTTKGFVKFDCSINEGELFFTVVDSGIGIPIEKQRAIFDRFVQVDSQRKSTYEGAGLGLAITKAFVDLLGGDIAVESEAGKGSTFYVRLPVEPASLMMAANG
jgi:signal transduction histidine kinase